MTSLLRFPGARLVSHAAFVIIIWFLIRRINDSVDPLANYYIALVAMYATAMFGMVILVGLSGQVSLGNGALMAVGGYVFAVTSLHWQTVPILGLPWRCCRRAPHWRHRGATARSISRRSHTRPCRRRPGHCQPLPRTPRRRERSHAHRALPGGRVCAG